MTNQPTKKQAKWEKYITIKRDGQDTWEVRMGDKIKGGIFLHDLDKFVNDALCIFISAQIQKAEKQGKTKLELTSTNIESESAPL